MKRLWVLLLVVACNNSITVSHDVYVLTPPEWYKAAWIETRECAGNLALPRASFSQITWYQVDADTFTINGTANGIGAEINNKLFISRNYLHDPRVVKHEMMHSITGINEHLTDPFYRCKLM